jgi:hypothetical protein
LEPIPQFGSDGQGKEPGRTPWERDDDGYVQTASGRLPGPVEAPVAIGLLPGDHHRPLTGTETYETDRFGLGRTDPVVLDPHRQTLLRGRGRRTGP